MQGEKKKARNSQISWELKIQEQSTFPLFYILSMISCFCTFLHKYSIFFFFQSSLLTASASHNFGFCEILDSLGADSSSPSSFGAHHYLQTSVPTNSGFQEKYSDWFILGQEFSTCPISCGWRVTWQKWLCRIALLSRRQLSQRGLWSGYAPPK